jgi:hypothetical protein
MNATLAITISATPEMSKRCGRSWRGRRRNSEVAMANAASPMGMLIQKMTDQCRCSAIKPPSRGPQPPAVV